MMNAVFHKLFLIKNLNSNIVQGRNMKKKSMIADIIACVKIAN